MPTRQGKKANTDNIFDQAVVDFLGLPPQAAEHRAKKGERKPPEEAAAEKLEQAKQAQEELGKQARKGKGAKQKR